MASGLLGKSSPDADSDTTVYTVPADTISTLNINVLNRGSSTANVAVAIATTGTPDDADYIEDHKGLNANGGVLERTAIVASAGEKVVVNCSTDNCVIRVHGFEENA